MCFKFPIKPPEWHQMNATFRSTSASQFSGFITQPVFACSKSTMEAPKQCVKSAQS